MKILCSTFGSAGDVFPMLGLALALRRRGHEVTLATNEHFTQIVRRHGVAFEPLGTAAEFDACTRHPDLWEPRRAFAHIFGFVKPILRRQYELHQDLAGGQGAAVTNVFGFGALFARERLGVPVVTMHCQPGVLWSDHKPPRMPGMAGPRWLRRLLFRIGERFFVDPTAGPFLNGWRGELGLPPLRRLVRSWHSPGGVVCLFPEWYCPPRPDWPARLVQTDFPLWNDGTGEGLPPDLATFLDAGPPPVVFTPGSANVHGREFFAACVEACRRLGRRGLLATAYPDQLPAALPKGIRNVRYAPFDVLLPRAAAFVHHGGIGSTSQGLAAGVPQVIRPLAHDQFDNAERVRGLGAGGELAVKRFTGARLAALLGELLGSAQAAAACRAAAERLRVRDGLDRAAEAVERLVTKA